MVFPYAFMNTDRELVLPQMFCNDPKKLELHGRVVSELETIFDPQHESGLHDHFKEMYIRYLESLVVIDSKPGLLQEMCEPSFFRKAMRGWSELKEKKATLRLMNSMEMSIFKLSLVGFSTHYNGYLDRDIDVRSKNQLRSTDGINYRYKCRWPYKNYVENTTQFVIRVETDLKLNLTREQSSLEGYQPEKIDLIP